MFKLVAIFFLFRQCITFLWKQVVYSFGQCALQNESQVWLIMNTYWGGQGKEDVGWRKLCFTPIKGALDS